MSQPLNKQAVAQSTHMNMDRQSDTSTSDDSSGYNSSTDTDDEPAQDSQQNSDAIPPLLNPARIDHHSECAPTELQWDHSILAAFLGNIGVIRGVQSITSLDTLWSHAMNNKSVHELVQGIDMVGSTDWRIWSAKGWKVFAGDGSAKEANPSVVRVGKRSKSATKRGMVAKARRLEAFGKGDLAREEWIKVENLVSSVTIPAPKDATYKWLGGVGMFSYHHDHPSYATAIPMPCPLVDQCTGNTSQVAEGLAFVCALTSCDLFEDVMNESDSNYWKEWLLSGIPAFITALSNLEDYDILYSSRMPKVFNHWRIKITVISLLIFRSGRFAISKVKGHAEFVGNCRADELAETGRNAEPVQWSQLEDINWNKFIDLVVRTMGRSALLKRKKQAKGARGDGLCLAVSDISAANESKIREVLFPHFSFIYAELGKLLDQFEADKDKNSLFAEADKLYEVHIEKVFEVCKPIVGTRRFGSAKNSNAKQHTKQFKARKSELGRIQSLVDSMSDKLDSNRSIKETHQKVLCKFINLPYQLNVIHMPALIIRARQKLKMQMKEVAENSDDDSARATKNAISGALYNGNFKALKRLSIPQDESKIIVPPLDFIKHMEGITAPPPKWHHSGLHLASKEQLWEVFGPSPGVLSHEADCRLGALPERHNIIEAEKRKKRHGGVGLDGVPHYIRRLLTRSSLSSIGKFKIDIVDLNIRFYSIVYICKRIFPSWNLILDFVLRKGGKTDYHLPKNNRNISIAVAPRKCLGHHFNERFAEWMDARQKRSKGQLFGKKGLPGINFAISSVALAIRSAIESKFNLLILVLDVAGFFPRITKDVLWMALMYLDVPTDALLSFMAFHGNNKAMVGMAGEIVGQYDIWGCLQGCPSSIKAAIAVTTLIAHQIESTDTAFQWPLKEIGGNHREWGIQPEDPEGTHGVWWVDDGSLMAGGGESMQQRKSAKKTISDSEVQLRKLYHACVTLGIPLEAVKTLFTGVLWSDNFNERIYPPVSAKIFSTSNTAYIQYVPIEQSAFKHLGVMQGAPGVSAETTAVHELERITAAQDLINNKLVHRLAKTQLWYIYLLGLRKYMSGKVEMTMSASTKMQIKARAVAKACLGMNNLPTAALHAPKHRFGLGLIDLHEFDLRSAVYSAMSLATADDQIIREYFAWAMHFTRTSNKVEISEDPTQYTFFNWRTDNIRISTVNKFPVQNVFTAFLKVCIMYNLHVVRSSRAILDDTCHWVVVARSKAMQSLQDRGEVSSPRKVVEMVTIASDDQQATKLLELASAGELARVEHIRSRESNLWKKLGKLSESKWTFQAKVCFNLLPTPAKMKLWGFANEDICKACSKERATQRHILNMCEGLDTVYSWRHDEIVLSVLTVVKKKWEVISVNENAVTKWLPANFIPEFRATKPDITLINDTVDKAILVRLVEISIAYDADDNLREAEARKIEKYKGLMIAIMKHMSKLNPKRVVKVAIVPLIIGSRGAMPESWFEYLRKYLLLSGSEIKAISAKCHIKTIEGSHWVWTKFCAIHHGRTDNQ